MVRDRIASILDNVSGVEHRTAVERSADLAFGEDFGDYITFLRNTIPDSALVAIPPDEISTSFGHNGLMQYYLYPRKVTNCPRVETFDDCATNLGGPTTFILQVRGFPAALPSSIDKKYHPLRDGFGVYAPMPVGGE
ncbi:MAG: hypothetical protein WBR18_15555 [Anaerolineales bacterium]